MTKTTSLSSTLNKLLHKELLLFITETGISFNAIQNIHLRKALVLCNPSVHIGSATYFKTTILESIFEDKVQKRKNTVSKLLECNPYVALTTDEMSAFGNSYSVVTGHFVDPDKNVTSHVLRVSCNDGIHDSSFIVKEIEEVKSEYKLINIVNLVTDGASNNIKAAKILGLEWSHCVVHLINLAIADLLERDFLFKKVVIKMNRIKKFYSKSISAMGELKRLCKLYGEPETLLCSYSKTRFTSLASTLNSFVCKEKSLSVSSRCEIKLTSEEWDLIKDRNPLMQQISELSDILGSEKIPTKELILPIIKIIKRNFQLDRKGSDITMLLDVTDFKCDSSDSSPNDSDTDFSIEDEDGIELHEEDEEITSTDDWRTSFLNCFEKRMENQMSDSKNLVATFLNSEQRQFLSEEEVKDARSIIINELKKANLQPKIVLEKTKNKIKNNPLSKYIVFNEKPTTDPITQTIEQELSKFVERNASPKDEDFYTSFPIICNIYRKIVMIPASSIPSERVFSKINFLISKRRSRISPQLVCKMVF